jgi:hypothetical protein
MIFVAFAAVVLFYIYGLRYVLTYRIGPAGLGVYYFGFLRTVYVPYPEIEEVRVVSFRESMGYGARVIRAGNRIGGPVVVVKRRSGLLKTVLLTPADAEVFVRELKQRMEAAAGRSPESEGI